MLIRICPDWHDCHEPPNHQIKVAEVPEFYPGQKIEEVSICSKCLEICKQQIAELPPLYQNN